MWHHGFSLLLQGRARSEKRGWRRGRGVTSTLRSLVWCLHLPIAASLSKALPGKTKPPAKTVKRASLPVTHGVMRRRTLYSPPLADVCSQERREEELSRTTFDSAGVSLERSDPWPQRAAGPWPAHLGSRFLFYPVLLFFFPKCRSSGCSKWVSQQRQRHWAEETFNINKCHAHILDTYTPPCCDGWFGWCRALLLLCGKRLKFEAVFRLSVPTGARIRSQTAGNYCLSGNCCKPFFLVF